MALGGRLGWACLIFTLFMFAFTIGLFEVVLAMPWPRPVFPVFQDFIFRMVPEAVLLLGNSASL